MYRHSQRIYKNMYIVSVMSCLDGLTKKGSLELGWRIESRERSDQIALNCRLANGEQSAREQSDERENNGWRHRGIVNLFSLKRGNAACIWSIHD